MQILVEAFSEEEYFDGRIFVGLDLTAASGLDNVITSGGGGGETCLSNRRHCRD